MKGHIKLVRLGCFLFYPPNHNHSKITRKQEIKSCVGKDYLVLCASLFILPFLFFFAPLAFFLHFDSFSSSSFSSLFIYLFSFYSCEPVSFLRFLSFVLFCFFFPTLSFFTSSSNSFSFFLFTPSCFHFLASLFLCFLFLNLDASFYIYLIELKKYQDLFRF